jgi:hypothetical protein
MVYLSGNSKLKSKRRSNMSSTTRFEAYTRTGKRKATSQRVFAIGTLGLLVLSLAMFAMPVSASGAEPAGDLSNGTSPLDGPEFWVAKYGTAAQVHLQVAQPDGALTSGTSPLDGPEFWLAKYGTATQVNFQVAQRDGALTSGTSPLDGPEFWLAKYGTAAQVNFQVAQPDGALTSGTSPLDGPEFYVARYGAEPAGCMAC